MSPLRKTVFTSPGRTVILTIMLCIVLGAGLLSLPFAQTAPVSFFDCFFMATSSVCVTGLMTVPLSSFSPFGQLIILLLIQVGALGLITLTVFFVSLFTTVDLSTRTITGEIFELTGGRHPISLAMFTIIFTLCCEAIGFIICTGLLYQTYPPAQAILYGLFHAISSFCSAGITPLTLSAAALGSGIYTALLLMTALLVLIGSLGFVVWYEIVTHLQRLHEQKHFHWSLHTRLVGTITFWIVLLSTIFLFFLEYRTGFMESPSVMPLIESFCNAVFYRSAGFTTLVIANIHIATLFIIMIMAFIGSGPGSTGSGVKITTFAIFIAAIKATLLRHGAVELKGRTIPNDQVFKAMAILALSLAWLAALIFVLFIIEEQFAPLDLIFEAVSAFANLGLSRGITPLLSSVGKVLLMASMLIGRIGSLTILLALKKYEKTREFFYPEERVVMS